MIPHDPSALIHDDLMNAVTAENPFCYSLWEPAEKLVVIGNSQKAENEVDLNACALAEVPVIKRRGGGGAVVLMPGVLCFSIAFLSELSDSPYFFFRLINAFLIRALEEHFSIEPLMQKGISDIALGERKILGSSMFKSRRLFFYQASLLVDPELEWIDRLLRHPSREPDYRRGRGHSDFVTSLRQAGYPLRVNQIENALSARLANTLYPLLSNLLDM
ncbi:hypothetical protein JW992_01880 [candidate division KSB1 bacterium]|nr:hypothetical protein [candidate division KSB1 bacterium]